MELWKSLKVKARLDCQASAKCVDFDQKAFFAGSFLESRHSRSAAMTDYRRCTKLVSCEQKRLAPMVRFSEG